MASTHYPFNHGTYYGQLLHRPLLALENDLQELKEIFGTMEKMLTGDANDEASYDVLTTRFEFADNASAKLAFLELASGLGKLTTNDPVQDVANAIKNMVDKLR